MTQATEIDQMIVSVREVRVVVERCLMLLDVPRGALTHVRELVLDAEVLGVGGLQMLEEALAADSSWSGTEDPAVRGELVEVDASGTSAMFLAPSLAALTLAAHADGRSVQVTNLTAPRFLDALAATTRRVFERSIAVQELPTAPPSWHLTVMKATDAELLDPVAQLEGSDEIASAVRHGIRVDSTLWWRLFHRSNDALTEDTPLSRAHAGAMSADVTDPSQVAQHDLDADYVAPVSTVLTGAHPLTPQIDTNRHLEETP